MGENLGCWAQGIMERAVHEAFVECPKEWILPRGDFMGAAWKIDCRRLSSGTKGWQPPKRERGHEIIASRD